MTLTTVPVMSTHGQYAIAHARATIPDGGVSDLIDLKVVGGYWSRAHIVSEWLRFGARLSGRWCVPLYLRTDDAGQLKNRPYVGEVREVVDGDPLLQWEAIERLTRTDADPHLPTFYIRPEWPRVKPFLLRITAPEWLSSMKPGDGSFRISGTLEQERLMIESIRSLEARPC